MTGRLEGKVAIVTGSTSGIGRGTAEVFAREGASVVVSGRRQELGEQVVAGIREAGGAAVYFEADLSRDTAIAGLIDCAITTYGRLDILVNNAYGGARGGTVVDCSLEDWDYGMTLGLRAAFMTCKLGIPHMIAAGGGSIINIASVHGVLAARHAVPYAPMKAGLIHLSRQIAVDYGPQHIRCNAICPGLVVTERLDSWFDGHPELADWNRINAPDGPWGRPIDIANVALFFASDESWYVSGQALVADGASTAQLPESALQSMTLAFMGGYLDVDDFRQLDRRVMHWGAVPPRKPEAQ